MNIRIPMNTRIPGYQDTWIHEYMDTWIHGYMNTRMPMNTKDT